MKFRCDCCGSILEVSEKGQESAQFWDLRAQGKLRCPACNGYFLKQIDGTEEEPEEFDGIYVDHVPGFGNVHYQFNGMEIYRKYAQGETENIYSISPSRSQARALNLFKQMFLIAKRETVARYVIDGADLFHYADRIAKAYFDLDYYIRLIVKKGSLSIGAWGIDVNKPDLKHTVTYRDISDPPGKDGDVVVRGVHLTKMKTKGDLELVILKSKVIILTARLDSVSMPLFPEKIPV
ncbi:hypothetical protein AGMMS49944_04060 [Spirochaetia bacterium]|nr:hypothetical protein AGMMS49944_04060 [Spirochaetia bacterium]